MWWPCSQFHFLCLVFSSQSWHLKVFFSTFSNKTQTWKSAFSVLAFIRNEIQTDTRRWSVKCLLLTSYFPTVCGHTQQKTALFVVLWGIPIIFRTLPPLLIWRKALCIKILCCSPAHKCHTWHSLLIQMKMSSIKYCMLTFLICLLCFICIYCSL